MTFSKHGRRCRSHKKQCKVTSFNHDRNNGKHKEASYPDFMRHLETTHLPLPFYIKTKFYQAILERSEWHFCNICLEFSETRTQLLGRPPKCAHLFCSDCIDQWITVSGSCPTCRKPMTHINYVSINKINYNMTPLARLYPREMIDRTIKSYNTKLIGMGLDVGIFGMTMIDFEI